MERDYLDFFGFKDNPFKITPDPDYYFLTAKHEEALYSLKYIYKSGEGFAVIIGEPGTGKTVTIRKFIKELPDNVEFAYILFPNLSPEELLTAILEDLGVEIPKDISKNKIFSLFRDFLIKKKKEGREVFVIIDEAQNLPIETLEELRILSNLETEDEKLIQIILLGQPELEEKLESPKLRQLKQRITVYSQLSSLKEREIKEYINFRLLKASSSPAQISNSVIKIVAKYSNGNPRIINQIMERALMAAFVDGTKLISKKHIIRAAESLGLNQQKSYKKPASIAAALILLISIISVIAYGFIPNKKENTVITLQELKKENNNKPDISISNTKEKKYYIMYILTTSSLKEAEKRKKEFESLTGKTFNILSVKNGKYYAVALLFENKKDGINELKILKNKIGKDDIFLTNIPYTPEIVK